MPRAPRVRPTPWEVANLAQLRDIHEALSGPQPFDAEAFALRSAHRSMEYLQAIAQEQENGSPDLAARFIKATLLCIDIHGAAARDDGWRVLHALRLFLEGKIHARPRGLGAADESERAQGLFSLLARAALEKRRAARPRPPLSKLAQEVFDAYVRNFGNLDANSSPEVIALLSDAIKSWPLGGRSGLATDSGRRPSITQRHRDLLHNVCVAVGAIAGKPKAPQHVRRWIKHANEIANTERKKERELLREVLRKYPDKRRRTLKNR